MPPSGAPGPSGPGKSGPLRPTANTPKSPGGSKLSRPSQMPQPGQSVLPTVKGRTFTQQAKKVRVSRPR